MDETIFCNKGEDCMNTLHRIFAGVAGIFAALAVAACGKAPDTAPTTALMRATILYAESGTLLVAPSDPDGSIPNENDVYSTVVSGAEITDSEGNSFAAEDLSAGQIVELIYDGYIQETYPAGIACSAVRIVGRQPDGWEVPTDLSQFFAEPDPNDPYASMPSMGVEYHTGETVSYTVSVRGSADWYEDGRGIAVDSALPFDGRDRVPVVAVKKGFREAKLSFSREPDSAALRCWAWEDFAENGIGAEEIEIPLDGGAFSWPEQQGKYLFVAWAEWENGSVSYYFAADSRPFALEIAEKIPLSAGEAAYTVRNRTGEAAEILLIPALERLGEDGWEEVPLEMGFCGVPDPLEISREGTVSFSWWPGLVPGRYRLSLTGSQDGEEFRVSCGFELTEG